MVVISLNLGCRDHFSNFSYAFRFQYSPIALGGSTLLDINMFKDLPHGKLTWEHLSNNTTNRL